MKPPTCRGVPLPTSRWPAVCGLALAMLMMATASSHAAARTAVLTKGDTWDPSAGVDAGTSQTVLSWTGYTADGTPRAFLRTQGAARLQLNLRGHGWAWGMDAAASTVSFQSSTYGDSNVRLYDWATATRSSAGPDVNTGKWEYEPSLSGRWLLFARWNRVPSPDTRRLFLYDRTTGSTKKLAEFAGGRADGMLESAQVNGDWVVWTTWRDRFTRATVSRYRISTGARDSVPAGRRHFDYLSAVGRDGTVYFLRSGSACGSDVTLRSYTTGGTGTRLLTLPSGRDGGDEMFAESLPGGGTELYLDTFRCAARHPNGDIWKVGVSSGAAAARGTPVEPRPATDAPRPKQLPAATRDRLAAITGGAR